MHVDLDSAVELSDESLPEETAEGSPKDVIAAGLASRADLSAQQKRELGARLNDRAVQSQAFPSLVAFADYGAIGVGIDQSIATHTVGVSLRIPVFDGGRRQAERAESLSGLHEEEIRSRDLRDHIELEVREAFDAAHSTREQLKLADEGSEIARDELAQARRRYEAGIASNLELVEAQQTTARAEEKQIEATFSLRQAIVDLWLATGRVRTMIR
jgi:outer membrane protein